jgi:hypothetical protein
MREQISNEKVKRNMAVDTGAFPSWRNSLDIDSNYALHTEKKGLFPI